MFLIGDKRNSSGRGIHMEADWPRCGHTLYIYMQALQKNNPNRRPSPTHTEVNAYWALKVMEAFPKWSGGSIHMLFLYLIPCSERSSFRSMQLIPLHQLSYLRIVRKIIKANPTEEFSRFVLQELWEAILADVYAHKYTWQEKKRTEVSSLCTTRFIEACHSY